MPKARLANIEQGNGARDDVEISDLRKSALTRLQSHWMEKPAT
jgi:hypothetical protein